MTAEVIHLAASRAERSHLDNALAAIRRHPKLIGDDKAAAAALARYATDDGFFDLDQRERMAVTRLGKWKLMSAFKRLKDSGHLHKASDSLFRFGERPSEVDVLQAEGLFDLFHGLRSLAITLGDTATQAYKLTWLVPKVGIYRRLKPSPQELATQLRELHRICYLDMLDLSAGDDGETMVRYAVPTSYEFARPRHGPSAGGAE